MPIRPEMRARYPKNWKAVRARTQQRAGNRCEWCAVPNGSIGYRDSFGGFHERDGEPGSFVDVAGFTVKLFRIVCTTAHIYDDDPANCLPGNLAFLCQRCHNRHDAPMRAKNAAATRAARGTIDAV